MKKINAAVLALALSVGLGGSATAESMPDKDIVQIAVSAGSFKTLVAAVQVAHAAVTVDQRHGRYQHRLHDL